MTNFIGTTLGTINVSGNTSLSNNGPFQGTSDISGVAGFSAAGTVIGNANLVGGSLLEFASGQISKIDASSELTIGGREHVLPTFPPLPPTER